MNRKELKYKVIYHYSNGTMSCACCGEGFSLKFLTIDHIFNDGNIHRKELKENGITDFYKYLIDNNYPDAYQVLCYNCNIGKYHNGGVCPHQASDIRPLKNIQKQKLLPGWIYDMPPNISLTTCDMWLKYARNYGLTYIDTKNTLLDLSIKHMFTKIPKKGGYLWTKNKEMLYWWLTR